MRPLPRLFVSLLLVAGCGSGSGSPDLAVDLAGADLVGPCDDTHPCAMGERCVAKRCVPDQGPCKGDGDCQNDSYCEEGYCVPYGAGSRGNANPACQGSGFPVAEFRSPLELCRWKVPMGVVGNVTATPLVIDLDKDGKPEIVFATADAKASGLFAIRGSDCSEVFAKPGLGLMPSAQLAAADLDGDKYPEIIAQNLDAKAMAFDRMGNLLAVAPFQYNLIWQGADCSGSAIADADGDGTPEIAISGQVLRYRPPKMMGGKPELEVLFSKPPSPNKPARWGVLSLWANLDGAGDAELVTGLKVFDLKGVDKTPAPWAKLNPMVGAYPQVADFNGDKKPDLLLVQSQKGQQVVSIYDWAAAKFILGPLTVDSGGQGGPAVIADFDGDGVADFGLAGPDTYWAYAMKCLNMPKPADCKGSDPGVLWERETRDLETGGNGSAAFDFNGDGRAEVVYRDKCWLRIMNGPDGRTLFAKRVTASTCLDTPVVADVDGDGAAELVITGDDVLGRGYCENVPEGQIEGEPFTASTQGVVVLRDPRWAPARPIWNQHTYHVTNVADDATVPKQELASWAAPPNGYRLNVGGQAKALPQPDFTGRRADAPCKAGKVGARLCNRGAAAAPAGVPGTFYEGDPRAGGKAICTAKSAAEIKAGECELLTCDGGKAPGTTLDLYFRAADDGKGAPVAAECQKDNGTLAMKGQKCE